MILSVRDVPGRRAARKAWSATGSSTIRDNDGRDAIFGLTRPLMELVNVFKQRRPEIRHRTPRAAAARPGRQLRRAPSPACSSAGVERYSRTDEGALYTFGWKEDDGTHHLVPDARRAAATRFPKTNRDGDAATSSTRAAIRTTALRSRDHRRLLPAVPVHISSERLEKSDGDWTKVARRRRRQAAVPLRAGPHRHRHVPAQGRKEPGLDRTHRRHQLPQNRRVRQRKRSAGLQLRRRIQRRQPRHDRVHRSPEARRRVPVRPAGRVAGTQDQAEEVRPDRHRHGHHRPHQRAGIPQAAVQRVHGSPARPDGEDRHSVRHQAHRRTSRFTRRTTTRSASAASTSPRTRWKSPRCGPCSPGWKSRKTPA